MPYFPGVAARIGAGQGAERGQQPLVRHDLLEEPLCLGDGCLVLAGESDDEERFDEQPGALASSMAFF